VRICSAGLALVLLSAGPGPAEDNVSGTPLPDEAFLLFLADWHDDQGNWQDPLDYDDPKWLELDTPQVTDHETPDDR
jgi:hypothetical protein